MVPVIVGKTTGLNAIAYDFTFTFNPKVIRLANPAFETKGTLSQGWSITANTSTPGQIRIVAFNSQPLSGSGTLIFIKFNVVGSPGATSPLTWISFPFNEGSPASVLTNGKFTVKKPSSKVGQVNRGCVDTEIAQKNLLDGIHRGRQLVSYTRHRFVDEFSDSRRCRRS
jgi:hypothetical protein